MSNKGFLLVFIHPPSAFEEEFNAWYDGEHIPERLAVPGFLTGLRYMNTGGGAPRYLAMYDIENYEVLDSRTYTEDVQEGEGHSGMSALVGWVARKL